LPDEGVANGTGIVICSALGYDAASTGRLDRHLAECAAAGGIACIRFCYDGTGDSAGDDLDADRVETWLGDIGRAVNALRTSCRIERVVLSGVRFGATLALMYASRHSGVRAVVAGAPVANGRLYVRELRALAAVAAHQPATEAGCDDLQEAAGFATTGETRAALSSIDLQGRSLTQSPADVLLLARTDAPDNPALEQRLQRLGSRVSKRPFDGYFELMLEPHVNTVPIALLQSIVAWVTRLPADETKALEQPVCRTVESAEFDKVTERAIAVSGNSLTHGVLSRPITSAVKPRAVLLLNAGAVPHTGPHRVYVRMARTLAARGVWVLRWDMPGLGESPAPPGLPENVVYPDTYLPDIQAAILHLQKESGAREVLCAGICSGAYHSLKAMVAGLPLVSAVIINPLTYFWHPQDVLTRGEHQVAGELQRYKATWLRWSSWKKLLSGKVHLSMLALTVMQRIWNRLRNGSREAARLLRLPLHEDLADELRRATDNGRQVYFVFSERDPGLPMLREQAGRTLSRLIDKGVVHVTVIVDADHTFTRRAAQQRLMDVLIEKLAPPQRLQKP
jgi:alpha-beta hydrolase superfamily lysophospholipase